ncbi:MAG: hypothetical protein PHP53_23615 [Prolixibacteraceae bacterium]|nr:hypothetical protein [Prolixibacteraceae bacterium]
MKKLQFLFVLLFFCFTSNVIAQNPYDVHQTIIKAETITIPKEKQFVEQNFPYIPMNKWKEGMRFIVPYNEEYDKGQGIHGMIPYTKSTKLNLKYISKEEFKWKIFTFKYSEYRNDGYLYLIFDCDGNKFVYNSYHKENDFNNVEDGFINGLVYVDEIDRAKEVLLNMKIYITNNDWYDENATKSNYLRPEKSKKFCPVTIVKIGIGVLSDITPVRIVFRTELGNEFYRDIKFSNTNNLYCGKIESYKEERANKDMFYNVFTFDDPYLSHPNISNEIWSKIQEGVVAIGMTEEECTLSWGKPKEINRSSYGSDQWVYSGQYLYFDDGKLTAFN